jgi:hypothetical protein
MSRPCAKERLEEEETLHAIDVSLHGLRLLIGHKQVFPCIDCPGFAIEASRSQF